MSKGKINSSHFVKHFFPAVTYHTVYTVECINLLSTSQIYISFALLKASHQYGIDHTSPLVQVRVAEGRRGPKTSRRVHIAAPEPLHHRLTSILFIKYYRISFFFKKKQMSNNVIARFGLNQGQKFYVRPRLSPRCRSSRHC